MAGAFDVVHANQVIEHVFDLDRFVSEIKRVLAPGGRAIICTENIASWHSVAALFLGLARAGRLSATRLVLMLTVYGALLELCQLWIPGRNAQVIDIAADFVGSSIGVSVATVLMRFYRKLTSTRGSLYLG